MTLTELRKLCVDGFPLSVRREPLMRSVEALSIAISTALITSEIWVDGSFLTQKMNPADVDLVVVVPVAVLPGTAQQKTILERIAKKDFTVPLPCDSYFIVECPVGHQNHNISEVMRAYWIKQFCFSRNDELKGLGMIRTPLS